MAGILELDGDGGRPPTPRCVPFLPPNVPGLTDAWRPAGRCCASFRAGLGLSIAWLTLLAPGPGLAAPPRIATGLDVVLAEAPAAWGGKRLGLLTHDAARAGDGRTAAEALVHLGKGKVVRLFAPEHGLGARAQGRGEAGRDPRTGLPCVTLDGATVQTVRQHLLPLDGLVVDIQDVGVRHYTYEMLVWRVVEAAGQARRPVWVLDRPTPVPGPAQGAWPVGGEGRLGGPPVPLCHGLTLGELALLAAAGMAAPPQLVVVPVQGWAGQPAYGRGGLAWHAPSPALRTPSDALRYGGLGLFEATNVACRWPGRAFAWFGAPWADGGAVARVAAAARLPGVAFRPEVHGGSGGVVVEVVDEARYLPIETGLAVLAAFARHHPQRFRFSARMMAALSGSNEVSEMLQGDRDWRRLASAWRLAGRRFEAEVLAVRLYGRGRSPRGTFPPSGRSATLGTP